ncbi:MAG: response regulator [Candidatus Korobacteraceae bacterium]
MPNDSKPQILVVDDETSIRESLGMLLVASGYDVAEAENGVSAVLHLNRAVPDLIVTDLNMPYMSGIELMLHVRSRYPLISIVAMSGDYEGDAVPAAIIADRFYPKGQHPHNLLTTIASLLETNPARGSTQESPTPPELDS